MRETSIRKMGEGGKHTHIELTLTRLSGTRRLLLVPEIGLPPKGGGVKIKVQKIAPYKLQLLLSGKYAQPTYFVDRTSF